MKPDLDLLSTLQPAEVSPFLFTRIQQRIQTLQNDKLSPVAAWSIAVLTALILLINISTIKITTTPSSDNQTSALLSSSNNLYNE